VLVRFTLDAMVDPWVVTDVARSCYASGGLWTRRHKTTDHCLMDEPKDEDEAEAVELGVRAGERMTRIHTLIGQYISDVNGIEQDLQRGIAAYFKQPIQLDEKFGSWLLARIETDQTVELVRQIAEDCGLRDYFDPAMKALRGAIKFRNLLAHGHLGLGSPPPTTRRDDEGVYWPTSEEVNLMLSTPTLRTPHRKKLQETLAEEEDLERRIGDLFELSAMATRFQIAMIMRSGGRDLLEFLRDLDERNPELPLVRTVPDYLKGA
jgi:hypothetical protein